MAKAKSVKESEAEIQKRIAVFMRNKGYRVDELVSTPVGIIDMVVTTEKGDVHLIEVKRDAESHKYLEALGQIRNYAYFYPGAKLWVATGIPTYRPPARKTVAVDFIKRINPDVNFAEF